MKRKTWWYISFLLVFGVVTATAETVKKSEVVVVKATASGVTQVLHSVTTTDGVGDFTTAECFNGNWFGVCLGCPTYPNDTEAVVADKKLGRALYSAILSQTRARDDAKAAGPLNYVAIANSAFWTSGVAWAYNNAGYALLSNSKDKEAAARCKPFFEKALSVLANAKPLSTTVNQDQANAYKAEMANRRKAKKAAKSNLLYVQRVLGEKPWPKIKK